MKPHESLTRAITHAQGTAIVAFITAGYPDARTFVTTLDRVCSEADAVEIGVPFSDPMADGITIQRSSREAIKQGVTLSWIFDQLTQRGTGDKTPLLLMSYLNPLLAFGYEALAARALACGVSGFIVPDLPHEESAPLAASLQAAGIALVQLVTPATPSERLQKLCAASTGFVYAVTRTGITGGEDALPPHLEAYLDQVKAAASVPVCAGFGIRSPEQVALIERHVDGIIVGSALVEELEKGTDPSMLLRALRGGKSKGHPA